MKIILSGGGTFGSVSPLIAVFGKIKKQNSKVEFLWVGTKDGSEKKFIQNYRLQFKAIESGKLRRYFSWQNFIDPFRIVFGFFQSLSIVKKFKPDVIVSSAAFVAVPLSWAGWLLKVPILIHQQDVRLSLANKLIAPMAKKITVTFEDSLKDFDQKKVVLTKNVVREEILMGSKEKAVSKLNLDPDKKTILVLGGGTGSKAINELVWKSVEQITKTATIIHLTGKGKAQKIIYQNYHYFEFVTDDFKDILKAADLVVCRASMSVISECAALKKAVVLIPIPKSHQEDNATVLAKNNAAIYLKQEQLKAENFSKKLIDIINDDAQLQNLSRNISKVDIIDHEDKLVEVIINLANV